MRRRRWLLAGAATLLTARAVAQAGRAPRRVGVLGIGAAASVDAGARERHDGLRERGFADGRDIVVDVRSTAGPTEGLARLAAQLAALKPAVIVAFGPQATQAALAADRDVPVVALLGAAVELGFAAGLARPGGRLTGVSFLRTPLNAKHLELLAELHLCEHAAGDRCRFRDRAASAGFRGQGARLAVPACESCAHHRSRGQGATARDLPVPQSARDGGLMAYGPNSSAMNQLLVAQVARILDGAKAGDLPIEQPTRFELVINMKTARALGLAIPQSLLLRADEVIE